MVKTFQLNIPEGHRHSVFITIQCVLEYNSRISRLIWGLGKQIHRILCATGDVLLKWIAHNFASMLPWSWHYRWKNWHFIYLAKPLWSTVVHHIYSKMQHIMRYIFQLLWFYFKDDVRITSISVVIACRFLLGFWWQPCHKIQVKSAFDDRLVSCWFTQVIY